MAMKRKRKMRKKKSICHLLREAKRNIKLMKIMTQKYLLLNKIKPRQ
jgi:hypothetical protein